MILDQFRLDGDVAVVTGGGGGLGSEVALALSQVGARVVAISRNPEKGEEAIHRVREAGGEGIFIKTDVTKGDDVREMVDGVLKAYGKIDILVNTAGIQMAKPILDIEEEDWHRVMDTNLTGTFLCCKFVGKEMARKKKGRIINISSTGGLVAATHQSSYCVSKAAVILFTKSLALELAKYNIRANAIAPGYLQTEFSASALENDDIASILVKRIPLRRFGKPEDIGPLVVYLASPASDYMTGETILIDGGHLAHM